MFEIIKRTSGFWHLFNNNSKEVNISSFDIVLDSVAQTYILQCKNGANVPNIEVPIANIIVRDETGANVDETFATVALLLARLIALSYTPYLNITGLTNDQLQAIQNANAPTGVNPFATMSDVGVGDLTIRPTQTGTTYTLVLADSNTLIPFSSTSNKTVTIPTNATVAFGIGDRIYLQATNTNNVTFTVAGAVGVTLTDPLGLVGNGGCAFILTKLATDSWLVEAMPFIVLGGSGNTLYTTKAIHGDGGFITSQDIFILAGRGLSDFGATQKFTLNAGGYYGANIPLRYDSALALSNALELVNLGFINTTQTIGDANASISASTTRAITSVDLTANRTWTLPNSGVIAGKTITIQDAHQTVGVIGLKIIIAVGSGKTLNGITNGTVFLDKIGQAITFYCDGSGNYTYENIVIPTLQEVLDNNHDLIDEVFSVGSGAGYDNVGQHVNSLGGGAGFENAFDYVNLLGENASADENGQTVLSKDGAILARISTASLTDTRKYTLQDSNGTIAHLSNIPSVDATPTDGSSNAVSSNGVFDALAELKPLVNIRTTSTALTGTTAETQITSFNFQFPANTFSDNDIMFFENLKALKTGILGTLAVRIRLSNTNNFATATQVARFSFSAGNTYYRSTRKFSFKGANLIGFNFSEPGVMNDISVSSLAEGSMALDRTQIIYGFISLALSNILDSAVVNELQIYKK